MLYNLIASSGEFGQRVLGWIEMASLAIEILAVLIILVMTFYAVGRYFFRGVLRPDNQDLYRQLKTSLGRALLLGLEILVAADIARTVALEATLESVAVLGLLVVIRTALGWSLIVELEGRWPWQAGRSEG